MAEFDLRLVYTNPPVRLGMRTLALLFPVWGIALPTTLILFIVLLLRLPADIPLVSSMAIIAIMLLTIGICTVCALACDDDEIRVSKDGIRFPIRFLRSLRFSNQKPWKDLVSLQLKWKRNDTFSRDEHLDFIFQDGGHARLNLQYIKPDELEQFFIAFEACAYMCERDAEIADFERALQSRASGANYSYTELWERSLSDRFSGATFTPLEPNTRLQQGRYQILRQLAFGGFSAVYLVRPSNTQFGNFVVLKESTFPQTDEVQHKASELFKREHELLSKIDNPNISRVFDYFVENQRHYLVVEHIKGIDLGRLLLQNGPQSPDVVEGWMKQIVSALCSIHSMSPPIVHRDLAPDNLVLKPDGTIVLIDFGAAKEIVGNFTGTIIGKQAFIAPEQFKGRPTPKSDIYSLGATIYYLLTARQPEPLSQSNPATKIPDLPAKLCQIVEQCTNVEESQRPSSTELGRVLSAEQRLEVAVND